jgi:hypothetical protein
MSNQREPFERLKEIEALVEANTKKPLSLDKKIIAPVPPKL